MRLTARWQRGTSNMSTWPRDRKVMLHVGCGRRGHGVLPQQFADWFEVRLDIAPEVDPDIVASIVDMPEVPSASVDGIWSSHNLEHVFAYEVPLVLAEFHRVLRPGGVVHIQVPDIQVPARAIAAGRLETKLYDSSAGPITPLDMFYGHGAAIARGEHFMAHRTGFTKRTLSRKLAAAGFAHVDVRAPGDYALWATGKKIS